MLVYLGYPQAHEDDAERAVRAGLELVAAVGALKTHAALQTRVGIATGLVVVGDLIEGVNFPNALAGAPRVDPKIEIVRPLRKGRRNPSIIDLRQCIT